MTQNLEGMGFTVVPFGQGFKDMSPPTKEFYKLLIDFQSDEALYTQLMNQIIMGIATSRLQEGDPLPSVRQLADTIGINMHTVNKAYSLLRQEGFVSIDRRKGAVICLDVDKLRAMEELKQNLRVALARGCCNNVTREEVHSLIDEILDEYEK